jgi:hypothetical protein
MSNLEFTSCRVMILVGVIIAVLFPGSGIFMRIIPGGVIRLYLSGDHFGVLLREQVALRPRFSELFLEWVSREKVCDRVADTGYVLNDKRILGE